MFFARALSGALPLVLLVACAQQGPTTPLPQFLKDAAGQAPFEIVLPTYLPHELELASVRVMEPPPEMDISEEGIRRNTRVELRYSNADGSAVFVLYESIALSGLGDVGVVPITIGGVEGEMWEDQERQFLSLAWAGEGIGFVLTAFLTGALTRDDLVRIAASTLK